MTDMVVARALHVLAIVVWISGVSMITTVVLPAVRHEDFGLDRLRAFQAVEHRFVWLARIALIVVGLSGFYMVARADLWDRFRFADFWWMHAMVCLWLLFVFILFVAEPLILQRHFKAWAMRQPDVAFAWLHGAHWVLLVFSPITIFGAVTGSHGYSIF